jgi:hypothetical protein
MNNSEAASAAGQTRTQAPLNYFNYFTEIEDAFIRRRGKHLLLSPMDWALIESWKEMGVPLHVALRGIEKSFDSYESRPRKRSVKSLMYCQEEVEAQFPSGSNRRPARTRSRVGGRTTRATPPLKARPSSDEGARGAGFLSRARSSPRISRSAEKSFSARCEERAGAETQCCAKRSRAPRRGSKSFTSDFERAPNPDAEALESSLAE